MCWDPGAFLVSPAVLVLALLTAAMSSRHRWTALYVSTGCVVVTLLVALLTFEVGGYE